MADGNRVLVELTPQELVLINNALNEILNGPSGIAAAHFPLRIGASVETARALLSRVAETLDGDPSPLPDPVPGGA